MVFEMGDDRRKKAKLNEDWETVIADLSEDELRLILILVAGFGARDLANALAVCRQFSKVGKCEDVLVVVNFPSVDLSEYSVRVHQQINGLVSLAAHAGNSIAQYMFGKIIMMSCTWSMRSEYENIHKVDLLRRNWIPNYFYRNSSIEDDINQARTFLADLNSKMSHNGEGLGHYHFVRVFLCKSPPSYFKQACYYLICYLTYFGKESGDAQRLLSEMWRISDRFRNVFHRLTPPDYKRQGSATTGSSFSGHLNAKFAQVRSQAIEIFDKAFAFQE